MFAYVAVVRLVRRVAAVVDAVAVVAAGDAQPRVVAADLVFMTRCMDSQRPDLQNILRFIVRLSSVYRKIDLR